MRVGEIQFLFGVHVILTPIYSQNLDCHCVLYNFATLNTQLKHNSCGTDVFGYPYKSLGHLV